MERLIRSGLRTGAYFHFIGVLFMTLALGLNIAHADGGIEAYVRFAHLAPGAVAVSVQVQGQNTVLPLLAYPTISNWYALEAGRYPLKVESIDNAFVIEDTLEADAGQWYTVALVTSGPANTAQLHISEEPVGRIFPGESRIGVFNALDNGGAIDLYANDSALLQYVSYPHYDSVTPTVDVIANIYELTVHDHVDSTDVVGERIIQSLSPEAYYLLILTGTTGNPLVFLTEPTWQTTTDIQPLLGAKAPAQAASHLRLAHFASGLGPVDLHINGERSAVGALSFPEVSPFVALPPGEAVVAIVNMQGTTTTNLISRTVYLEAGAWYTVALIGSNENNTLQLQPFVEDFSALEEDQTRIGVFQAIPGIAPLNVLDAEGSTLVRLLGYPGSQGDNDGYETVDLPVMTTQIRFVSAADPADVLVTLTELAYIENRHYLIATLRADPPYTIVTHELVNENRP